MKLATQIFLGFLVAISIDLLDSYINFRLTLRVKTISKYLDRSEDVIRHSAALNKDRIEMESAFHKFLLTGDHRTLAPYELDRQDISARGKQLHDLVTLPGQKAILDSIFVVYGQWVEYADRLTRAREEWRPGVKIAEDFRGLLGAEIRKGIGEEHSLALTALFNAFNGIEYRQRDLRKGELDAAIHRTDRYSLIFSVTLILIGLAIAVFLVRKIARRIGTLVKLAERISRGDFGQVRDDKKDELSSLSVSLNLMSERLSRNISELEKRNIELDQFAYVVSHDLKAPVRGISSVIRWMEEDHSDEITPTIRKYLDFIPDRLQRMESLIDGLLEYARAGREGMVKEEVDVSMLVGDLVDLIVPEGYTVRRGALPVLFTQRLPLQQVFSNLFANAVKYCPPGRTIIDVSCIDYGTYYEFTVKDNGPGIDPEFHEKIFGLFQTLREKADKGSTGIGLAIVRKIVEERGGSIRIISSLGNGASFIFTWSKTGI